MSNTPTTTTAPTTSTTLATSATRSQSTLFSHALSTLPKDKPLIFTNLLRFRPMTTYTHPHPQHPSHETISTPCPGAEAYWHRYFPIYHQACIDTLGEDGASKLQRVLYKGSPLMPLRLPSAAAGASNQPGGEEEEGYWHGVVMTRCESWEVVERIGRSELYSTLGSWHREAAVEDDVLYVSCPVDGFEMVRLD